MRRKIKRRLWQLKTMWKHRRLLARIIEQHSFFLEQRSVTVWGGISAEDQRGLREAVARAAAFDGPIVEIGTLFGWTTQLLAGLKAPGKELIAVENFSWNPFCIPPDDHRVITRRTLHYCLENCRTRIYDGSAQSFYNSYRGPVPSMVFIDGDHSYEGVQADIEWATKLGVPVIAGHDYNLALHQPIVRAVHERFGETFDLHGTVWIASGRPAQAHSLRAA